MALVQANEDGTVTLNEGDIVRLDCVKLGHGDIGFRCGFVHKGQFMLIAKLLPLGLEKPKDRQAAIKMAQYLIDNRPDLVEKYRQGMEIEYRQ